MSDFLYKSPTEWIGILNNIKEFLKKEWKDIETIKLVYRCGACYKKTSTITLTVKDDSLTIDSYDYNCNSKKESNHSVTIKEFSKENLDFSIIKNEYTFFLAMKYYMGGTIEIPLTSHYPLEDYEVHGEFVYRDRNLKMIQRDTENGLVIMLQNFIDFKGLSPRFSDTIFIKWKE